MEEWKQVSGWPYEVSNHGRVRRTEGGQRTRAGRVRKNQLNPDGYEILVLSRIARGRTRCTVRVHSLVAEAFIGPRPFGAQVNHIDGDKTNNRVENLEYVTPSENQQHSSATGLFADRKGEAHGRSKITADDVREIRRRRDAGAPLKELADEFGIGIQAVSMIANRKRWKHIE